jgi:DNA integrity scanning protein DisA with diadenylate cyclase activity
VLDQLCDSRIRRSREVLGSALRLALEIAREGREGLKVGTLLTVGRADAVLARSRPLILDPFAGHAPEQTNIADPRARGTLKALAQIDGAFVISDDGAIVAGCRYLEASTSHVEVAMGFGSRHLAGAAVSHETGAVAVVVSQSGAIRVYDDGKLQTELRPADGAQGSAFDATLSG